MDMQDFKMSNLKEIREKKNITQVKVSVDVEVSQELISQYEMGKSKPNIENLIKLAEYFNCSTDYLLGLTDITTRINNIDKSDIELADIMQQYKSLSKTDQEHLKSYLNHLSNNSN